MATKRKRAKASAARKTGRARTSASWLDANGFYGDLLSVAGSVLRNQQRQGAERINTFASSAYDLAAGMKDMPHVAEYMEAAGDKLEELSDYVSQSDFEDIANDAMNWAKRNPVATVAIATAVGIAITRTTNMSSLAHWPRFRRSAGTSSRATTSRSTARPARRAKSRTKHNGSAATTAANLNA